MSLLETAYKIYEYEDKCGRAGVKKANEKALVPASHIAAKADIEIKLNADGTFVEARKLAKEEKDTIIPATLESANRTSAAKDMPHPLEDQLRFLVKGSTGNFDKYLTQLKKWEEFSRHPKLAAILRYIESGSILSDLKKAEIVRANAAENLEEEKEEKLFVRFTVFGAGEPAEAYRDLSLFDSFAWFYKTALAGQKRGICGICWKEDETLTQTHSKGVLAYVNGAKLISANDDTYFTYRGRFDKPEEAAPIGYDASQKAHNALRWLVANQGVRIGSRTFLWYKLPEKEEDSPYISFGLFAGWGKKQDKDKTEKSKDGMEIQNFRRRLRDTVTGFRNSLVPDGKVIVAAFEAATTGRLSVTYYNEIGAQDFAGRVTHWYDSMTYNEAGYTPNLRQIVSCAFGSERNGSVKAEDKIASEAVQRLLHCVVGGQQLPEDIVLYLTHKFGRPLSYNKDNLRFLQETAFAAVKKYRNEKYKEEWKLALDENCADRSYLFGRLLAIAEKLEDATYDNDTRRPTNALKMQAAFSQRPMTTWRVLEEKLAPYKTSLLKNKPGLEFSYEKLIGEIFDKIRPDDTKLNTPLSELYVLGYYHQRKEFYRKKLENTEENKENEGEKK